MNTIGTASQLTEIHIETIRYYERVGLTPRPARAKNGRRSYTIQDIDRLRFIRHARDLGFALPTIRTLIDLQERPQTSCARITELSKSQLATVEHKIAQLVMLRDELMRMIARCRNGKVANCRIIEAMTADSAKGKSRAP